MEEGRNGGHYNRFETLAPEIISNILSRLAIEWIFSCMCVCKNWCELIKDDCFVRLQLSISSNRPSYRVLLKSYVCEDRLYKLYLLDVEYVKAREIHRFKRTHILDINVVMCSLDGLICVAYFGHLDPVKIYNPLIRGDCVILPKSGAWNLSKICNASTISQQVALGYDTVIKKYKAVRLIAYSNNQGMCEVITLGEEKAIWRRVEVPHDGGLIRRLRKRGFFHGGSIYWIIENRGISTERDCILEFNISEEVFEIISFPRWMKAPSFNQYDRSSKLQTLGGSLALMQIQGGLLHIWWIKKENGDGVIGYRSTRMESAYKNAKVVEFICLNGGEDFLLLQTDGGYQPGRKRKGEARKMKEGQLLCYYPFSSSSKKSDRFVNLTSTIQIPQLNLLPVCYKPSLVSAKKVFGQDL